MVYGHVRLAKEVQKGTPSCPEKARKMGLKANNMSAPFKQVYILHDDVVLFVDWKKYEELSGLYARHSFDNLAVTSEVHCHNSRLITALV